MLIGGSVTVTSGGSVVVLSFPGVILDVLGCSRCFFPLMRWATNTLHPSSAAPASLVHLRTNCGPTSKKMFWVVLGSMWFCDCCQWGF